MSARKQLSITAETHELLTELVKARNENKGKYQVGAITISKTIHDLIQKAHKKEVKK